MLEELDFGNFLTLKTDVEIKFKSSGNSAHEIMAGLDGYARLVGSDGRLNDAVLATVSTGFMDALPWVANADSNIINCVVADFPVKSGVAVARRMFMDTNGMSVNASGSINLGKETIDLLISPVAKNVSLGSFAVPVGLTGTLAKPEFGINPAGAVVGTIGNVGKIVGSGAGSIGDLLGGVLGVGRNDQPPSEYDPCINLLSNKKSAPAKTPVSNKPKPQKSTTIDKVKDITKGIGQGIEQGIGGAIKGIFGNQK